MSDLDLDDHHVGAALDGNDILTANTLGLSKTTSERLEKSKKDTFGIKNQQREQQEN